ncbi:helix-turn-helix domain-containing protein [Turicibacter sanguinis]|uniref:helix-turn-helix domain-containing protein n=1 Tax=Turicibacter sanguinis TaxID=154288 RepID=UPI0006C32523|nr:helix-turn-helix transcriptional regulator [Turicibacter sanguinis]MDB8438638.1 helix-turn-helix transcriptional regulator [Turicibacter sanguinis]CUN12784.1 conjugal transfer protein TrbA [Turicibacter sanguinis]
MSKIKEILKKKEITQKQLAKQTGISYSLINDFAVGRVDITLKRAKKIADALGVKVDDLI